MPSEAEPRGWLPEQWPAVVAAVEAHRVAYRAAQLAGLEKAQAVRAESVAAKAQPSPGV